MDKSSLLIRLAEARDRAEKAHLNVVLLTLETSEGQANERASATLGVLLKAASNEEQLRLREMEWILDQLDRME